MPDSGESRLQELQQDLSCLNCGYNLRGLIPDDGQIRCPECGAVFDATILASPVGRDLSWRTPGLTVFQAPAWWFFLSPLLLLLLFPALVTTSPSICVVVGAVAVGAWCLVWWRLLTRAWRHMPGFTGIQLVVLSHAVMAGYLVAGVGIVFASAWTLGALLAGALVGAALWFVGTLLAFGLLWLSRRLERHIARACLRHHLSSPVPTPLAPR